MVSVVCDNRAITTADTIGPMVGGATMDTTRTPTPDNLPLDPAPEEVVEDLLGTTQPMPLNTGGSADANSDYLAGEDLDRHTATGMSVTSLFSNLFTDGREFGPVECEVSRQLDKN